MASPVYNGAANFSHLHGTVELEFSLKVPAADGAFAVWRDSKGAQVLSASSTAGVITVTFNDRVRMPRQLTAAQVSISQPAATTTYNMAHVVTDSLDVSARTVQIVCTEYADGIASIVLPVSGSWISVCLKGPTRDDLKDAA